LLPPALPRRSTTLPFAAAAATTSAKCFSSWSSLHSGAWFQAAIVGKAGHNDEASIGLWFELEEGRIESARVE
jgi:hypothetical protein